MTNDDWLRLAPVGLPMAGFVIAVLVDALAGRRLLTLWIAVATLAGTLLALFGGAVGLGGYGSEVFGLDRASGVFTGSAVAFALATIFLASSDRDRPGHRFPGEFLALVLLVPAGVGLVAGARHLLVLFLGIELLSVPLYTLVAMRRGRGAAVEGAVKYFLLGAFAAGFLLYGMALLFSAEGTLDVARLQAAAGRSTAGTAGAALVLVGLLFKVSAAPFHFWTPDAYEGASTPVTALMASATKVAAVAALLLVVPMLPASTAPAIAAIAVLTIVAGNLGALVQERTKRLLAYSSVAHAGTLLLALAAERSAASGPMAAEISRSATISAAFYLAAYGASVLGAFGVLAMLERGGDSFARVADLRGLGRRRPGLALLFSFFALSLAGIPPTGGFWAKYLVFATAIRAEMVALAVAAIVLTVIGAAYYLRLVATCFMSAEEEGEGAAVEEGLPWPALLATVAAAVAVAALGLFPDPLLIPLAR